MVFREVSVIEVREALRAWLAGKSERAVAVQAGVDRNAYCAWRGPAFRLAVSQCAGAGEPWRRTRVSRGSGGAAHLRWAAPVAGLASRSG